MESSVSKPPFHKELLVALFVGGLFGPLVGWLGGMLAMFFASAAIDETRGMRTSAFYIESRALRLSPCRTSWAESNDHNDVGDSSQLLDG